MKLREQIEKYIPENRTEEKDKEVILKYIDTFDNILERSNEFAHFTVSSWIVNNDFTKVLLIYHNIYDAWAWTGGHCDGDSYLLEVAIKEAKEETGVENIRPLSNDIVSLEILTVESHEKRDKIIAPHLHLNTTFLFQADEKDELKIKEDENKGVKWIEINNLFNEKIEEKMKPTYKKLINKSCKYKK